MERAKRKASQSTCTYKVAAIGFNRRGEIIHTAVNRSRFDRKDTGVHAEMRVMLMAGPALKTVIICRVNNRGDLLPIEPCPVCQKKAEELGVRIVSIES